MSDRIELVAAVGIAICGALALAGTIALEMQRVSTPPALAATASACLGYLAGVLVRRRNGH